MRSSPFRYNNVAFETRSNFSSLLKSELPMRKVKPHRPPVTANKVSRLVELSANPVYADVPRQTRHRIFKEAHDKKTVYFNSSTGACHAGVRPTCCTRRRQLAQSWRHRAGFPDSRPAARSPAVGPERLSG